MHPLALLKKPYKALSSTQGINLERSATFPRMMWGFLGHHDKYQPPSAVRERELRAYVSAVSQHIMRSFSSSPSEPPKFARGLQMELIKQHKAGFKSCGLMLDFHASEELQKMPHIRETPIGLFLHSPEVSSCFPIRVLRYTVPFTIPRL